MKLSETKNPRTGQPFTAAQLQAGATKHGLSWMRERGNDPELSEALVAAITELGWTDPNATLARAAKLQAEARAARQAPADRVRWYNGTVWIDGALASGIFATAAVAVLRASGVAITGDGFSGSAADAGDDVIAAIRAESAIETDRKQAELTAPKTAQVWDGEKPSYI
jgi:hypothetical protein